MANSLSVSAAGGQLRPHEQRIDGADRVVVRDACGNALAVIMVVGDVILHTAVGQPDFEQMLRNSGIPAIVPKLVTRAL